MKYRSVSDNSLHLQSSCFRSLRTIRQWSKANRACISKFLIRVCVSAAALLYGALATSQQVIVDPSAPGTAFLLSGNQTPLVNIAVPTSGVSHNRYLQFNVSSDGLILNNSQSAGTSSTGGAVAANSNLLVSGPATVILNEVKGGVSSSLSGTTEVFGSAADVIIANPGGIICNGCRFLNTTSSTLSTGVPSITNGQVSLAVRKGEIRIGPNGFETEHKGAVHGRHIVIDGPVSTVNQKADDSLVISGGSQNVNLHAGSVAAAPVTTAVKSPYVIDASELGAMNSGSITIIGNETGLGVNLYGGLESTQDVVVSSQGDLFYGDVDAGGSVSLHGGGGVRQYGDLTAVKDISVSGARYTLYRNRTIDTSADVEIQSDDSMVIAGEISGQNIDLTGGTTTNNGFILADEKLSVEATDISQQREIATEYDIYLDPALKKYLQAYQYQLLQGGEQADIAAQLISRASKHEIIAEHILRGATMSGTDIEMQADEDITNTGGAMAATNDMLLTAGADIINEYLELRRLLDEKDGCPREDCGYRVDFHAGELLAGNDLILNAGGNFENRASDMAAGGEIQINAGVDIVNSLTSSNHDVHSSKNVKLSGNSIGSKLSCHTLSGKEGGTYCTTKTVIQSSTYSTKEYHWDESNVLSPGVIATLYGDINLSAGRNFTSIGSEVSAGGDISIEAGEEATLSSFVDAEEDFIRRRERSVRSRWNGKEGTTEYSYRYRTVTYKGTELITATSNLVGNSVSIRSGADMSLTGVRLLAARDLDLRSTKGSILIDSTHLPSTVTLSNDQNVQFVVLESDVTGQIFGESDSDSDSDDDTTDEDLAQNYISFLQNSELLTAVEALRRADSGADIKKTVQGVGVQSHVSLIGDDYLQSLRKQAKDAISEVYETLEGDIKSHADAVADYHASLQRKLSEATSVKDADETATTKFIQEQVAAVNAAAKTKVGEIEAEYKKQMAANQAKYGHLLTKRVKVRYYDSNYGKNGAWRTYWKTVDNPYYINLKKAADAKAATERTDALAATESKRLVDVALMQSADTDDGLNQLIKSWSDDLTAKIAVHAKEKAALIAALDKQLDTAVRIAETLQLEELELQSVEEKLVAKGSVVSGEPSLAVALTNLEFPELSRVQDLSVDDDGLVENSYEHEVERTRTVTVERDNGHYEERTEMVQQKTVTSVCSGWGKNRYCYNKVSYTMVPVTRKEWVSNIEEVEVEETYTELQTATGFLLADEREEQDAFVDATAWRFATFGGIRQLTGTPRSVVFSETDLSVNAKQDFYVTGATTVAAKDDVDINAGRRIGLLGAINTEFRLGELAHAAFPEIGETLQLGTLKRNPYEDEAQTTDSGTTDDLLLKYASQTANYDLVNTMITAGGDLILRSGGDIMNFGGSVTAGENLYVSTEGDIRNEALRRNFTLTSRHGCYGGACGRRGHDYRPAEFLSGSSLLLASGADIINRGSVLSAASMLMAQADRDIVNSAITSQYLYYYVNKKSFFGLKRKKKLLYRAVIGEGDISTEYGSVALEAGRDIKSEGSSFSAGTDVLMEAGRDVLLSAKSEELHNYYKKRGFSGLSYGSTRIQWNEFKSAFTKIEGDGIRIRAGGDVSGSGALLFAANDIDIAGESEVTFDAHQNRRYFYKSGWSIGISFGGSNIVESVLSGADGREVFEAYLATNPSLAAVHQLATAKDQWGTINGLLNLGYHLPALASAVNRGSAGHTDTITESLFKQLNPFSWVSNNAVLTPKNKAKFKDFVTGITFRLSAFSSQREWTESHVSQLVAGGDLQLEAGGDLALVGGTVVSAAEDMRLLAGDDILVAALADSSRTSSSSWGLSLGFAVDGITFGADLSRTSGSSRMYTNAALTAGGHLDIISNRDTALLGANVKAKSIAMDVGSDLIVQSRQNVSASKSHGFTFKVTMSGSVPTGLSTGVNNSASSRRYTDNPTTVVAQEALSIYTGDTTYLLGSAIYSEAGGLDLDTGSLIFDNYIDTDKSTSTSIDAAVGFTDEMTLDAARSDASGSLAYRNVKGVTYATLGAGTVRVRAAESDFTLAALNRDPANLQQVLSSSGFALEVPGINLKRWSEQVEDMANLIEAVSAKVPDEVRTEGARAVDLYRDLILSGVSEADARRMIGTNEFQHVLDRYRVYRMVEQKHGPNADISKNVQMALALGYGVLLGEASAHPGGSFTFPCDAGGGPTVCEIALSEFNNHLNEHGADDALEALRLLNRSVSVRGLRNGYLIELKGIGEDIRGLLLTLRHCAITEPEVYLKFIGESESEMEERRALIEWAGEKFGADAEAFYVVAKVIRDQGTADEIEAVWKANVNPYLQFGIGVLKSFKDTVDVLVEASEFLANVSGINGNDARQKTFEDTMAVMQYIAANPEMVTQQIMDNLVTFGKIVMTGDPQAIGYLTGGVIVAMIPAGVVTKALIGTKHSFKVAKPKKQLAAEQAAIKAKIDETESWPTKSKPTLTEKRGWHDGKAVKVIKDLIESKKFHILNAKFDKDGNVNGYRNIYLRGRESGMRTSPDIVVVDLETGKVSMIEIKTGNARKSKNQETVFDEIEDGNAVPLGLLRDLVKQYNKANPKNPIPDDFHTKIGEVDIKTYPGILD